MRRSLRSGLNARGSSPLACGMGLQHGLTLLEFRAGEGYAETAALADFFESPSLFLFFFPPVFFISFFLSFFKYFLEYFGTPES